MDVGAELRAAREAHGLSLGSISQRTRVQPRILTAIEQNDVDTIPPRPYGRGFVRAYATEVGLDPERTVHDYFAQFPPVVREQAPPAPEYESPRSSSWLLPLAGIAVLAVLVGSALRGREPAAAHPDDAVGTSGDGPDAVPASTSAAVPAPAPAVASVATPDGLNLVLTVNEDSWITATADGDRVVYRLLAAGSQETLRANDEITLLAGNAGAVALTINGRPAGVLGRRGEVRTLRINPRNAGSIGR